MSISTYTAFQAVRGQNSMFATGALDTVAGVFQSVQGDHWVIDSKGDSSFGSVASTYATFDELSLPTGITTNPPLFISATQFKSTHDTAEFKSITAQTINTSDGGTFEIKGDVTVSGLGTPNAGMFLVAKDNSGALEWSAAAAGTNDPSAATYAVSNLTDVTVGSQTDTQVLAWHAATSRWKPMDSLKNLTVTTALNVTASTCTLPDVTATTLTTSGLVTALKVKITSDARLKENIEPLECDMDALMKLKPVSYNFIGDGETSNGFLAQDIADVLPNISSVTNDKWSVDAHGIVPCLVSAMQKMHKRIEELEQQLND